MMVIRFPRLRPRRAGSLAAAPLAARYLSRFGSRSSTVEVLRPMLRSHSRLNAPCTSVILALGVVSGVLLAVRWLLWYTSEPTLFDPDANELRDLVLPIIGIVPIAACTGLGLVVARVLPDARVLHALVRGARKRRCVWCGYDMAGSRGGSSLHTCPECGGLTPVEAAPTPEQPGYE